MNEPSDLDRLAEEQGVKPITSIDELRASEEIDDFTAFYEAIRSCR